MKFSVLEFGHAFYWSVVWLVEKAVATAMYIAAGLWDIIYDYPFQTLFVWVGIIILAHWTGHKVGILWFIPVVAPLIAVWQKYPHPRR